MAKDSPDAFGGSASTEAIASAIREHQRRLEEIASQSTALADAQLTLKPSFAGTLASAIQSAVDQFGTIADLKEHALAFRSPPSFTGFTPPTTLASLADSGLLAEAVRNREALRTLQGTSFATPFLDEAKFAAASVDRFHSFAATLRDQDLQLFTTLRDQYRDIFTRSNEMVRAVASGLAALKAREPALPLHFRDVLDGVRLNRASVSSAVEELARSALPTLGSDNAHNVALAFEHAIETQINQPPAGGNATVGELEGLLGGLEERLVKQLGPGWRASEWLNLCMLLLTILAIVQQREASRQDSESDRANTLAVTSRQDSTNALLRRAIDEFVRRAEQPVVFRLVDRPAALYSRPRKGSSVIAILPAGMHVAIISIARQWREVAYRDAKTGATRVGWIMSKYLRRATVALEGAIGAED
jgi:hypothetical protein